MCQVIKFLSCIVFRAGEAMVMIGARPQQLPPRPSQASYMYTCLTNVCIAQHDMSCVIELQQARRQTVAQCQADMCCQCVVYSIDQAGASMVALAHVPAAL